MLRSLVLAVFGFSTLAVAAQEHPTVGMVYSLQEKAYLQYECTIVGSRLSCEFVQTNIQQSPGLEQMQETNRQTRTQMAAGEEVFTDEDCAELSTMRGDLEAKTGAELTEEQRREALLFIGLVEDVCRERTIANLDRLSAFSETREARTCQIRSQTFNQTFTSTSPGNWVITADPHGPCGVVRLDRFRRVDSGVEGLPVWEYLSQRVVTTPDGMGDGPMSCSILDEGLYEYTWRSQAHTMDCKYVEFGWF